MRITGVEIANYRGFAGESFRLPLENGENLLVYGENGAGKSSLYNTLKDFLQAASNARANIEQQRNRDNPNGPPTICITTTTSPATAWTQAARGQDTNDWRNLDDGKGFLDYRVLLRFYNATHDGNRRIDLFKLLLEGMLAHHRMEVPGNPTFLSEWRAVKRKADSHLYENERQELKARVGRFNAAFQIAAGQLATRATELLHDFDPDIGIAFARESDADFTWYPKHVSSPAFVAEATRPNRAAVTDYHEVFNEAKLSAMAICLFFAALQTCPIAGPRLLVLDDVLIGLDMANRRKVVNLVQELFPDWQIIILTYHKAWFEILKARIKVGAWGGHEWRSIVLRPEKCPQTALVTIAHEDSGTALETAEHCLAKRDHKAAAVYARTALEALLHKNADRLHLPVRFKRDQHKLNTEHFLQPIEQRFDHLTDPAKELEGKGLLAELRFARRTVLNAFAHADEISEDEIAGEIEHGISVVRQFQDFMEQLQREDFDETVTQGTLSIPELLTLATKMANAGNAGAALDMLEKAAHALVQQRCELKRAKLEFRRHYPHSLLFGAAFPKTDLSPRAEALLRMVGPYLLGCVDRDHFDPARFAAALRFVAQVDLLDSLPLFASHPTPIPPNRS
jgi:energy-coupling factor transporter ATP-binding protein EcfA2